MDFLNSLPRPTLPEYAFVTRLNIALFLLVASESNSFYLGSAIFKTLASLSFFFGGLGKAFAIKSKDVNNIYPLLWDFLEGKLLKKGDNYAFFMVLGLGFSVLGDVLLVPSREKYFAVFQPAQTSQKVEEKGRELKGGKKKKGARKSAPAPAPSTATTKPTVQTEGDTLSFKAGTFFFALAHIAYTVAFLSSPTTSKFNWVTFVASASIGLFISRLLGIFKSGNISQSSQLKLNIPDDMAPLVKAYVCIITTMVGVASATDAGYQKTVGAWMFMISDMFVAVDVFGKKVPAAANARREKGRPGWKFRSFGWWFYFWAQVILAGTI